MDEAIDVIIVGGGPTGLMLAGELALAGAETVVVERRTSTDLVGTRARGFHCRTMELFDQRGLADRFLAVGTPFAALRFSDTALEIGELPTRHPYTLSLEQNAIEAILRDWVAELGVATRRGLEVSGLVQDDEGVQLQLAGGGSLRAAYVVGADGGRSTIRRAAGIELVGTPATHSYLLAEAELSDDAPMGMRQDELGIHGLVRPPGAELVSIIVSEAVVGPPGEPSVEDLRQALRATYGADFGVRSPSWISRFSDAVFQASRYRAGRVLVAGDAAHVHPPTGGQGLGLGVQDAANLGWKLGKVVRGDSPATLLDTYQEERHPATARVLTTVMTLAQLQRGDARTLAIRASFDEALRDKPARLRMAALLTGLDHAYDGPADTDPNDRHPLVGRRVPDVVLVTPEGVRRLLDLLHAARPLLLDLTGSLGAVPLPRRVVRVAASYGGAWELPVVGRVAAPSAVLIRPDGHAAWVGDGSADGLAEALATWSDPVIS